MYTIPSSSPGLFSVRLLRIGAAWIVGYTTLGVCGGAIAFGLINYLDTQWQWSASLAAAWVIVALLCGPMAIWIQYRVLRPSGLLLRDWLRASWITFLLLGLASSLVVGGAALLTRQSPMMILHHPVIILEVFNRALGLDIQLSDRGVVMVLRGLTGLLIGVTQAHVWWEKRLFFMVWVGACTSAGLISFVGERIGVWLGRRAYAGVCTIPGLPCPRAGVLDMVYGGCYWGMTWFMMALVTVGPALYLVRLQPQPTPPKPAHPEPFAS